MKNDVVYNIQLQMKPFLNQGQYLKLTNVLVNTLNEFEIVNQQKDLSELDSYEFLNLFLSAKEIEGCSLKTIKYYRQLI